MRHFFLFLCAISLLSFQAMAENYYIDHVAEENWTTSITVYNDGPDELTFDLQRWDDSGTALTTLTGVSVPANSSTTLTNADFGYNGTAMVVTPLYATLVVKLSYRYQDSHSLCEFFIPEEYLVSHWMLPNPYHGNFDWFGVAAANFTGTTANVTFTAWHNGTVVDTVTKAVAPHQKLVDVSSGFWSGINYADVDMVTMDSDIDIPAPLSITGNDEQDRHVFFLAKEEPATCDGSEKAYAIPHVAESNWTTKLTAYNNEDAAQSFTFSSWNADGSADVTAQVVSVPAHGTAVLTAGTNFVYSGTASITTNGCMQFKLTYQYGTSESLCEFFLGDSDRVQWFIPNSIHDWFNWFGVALCNPTDNEVVVTLDAYKDGQLLATSAKTLAPHTKTVGLSSDFWPDITTKGKDAAAYSDVDMVEVRSSAPIPRPLSITGNTAQDRHVFFLADQDAADMDVPDKNFWAYLLANFDTNHDGTLDQAERDAVTEIDTPGAYGEAQGNIRSIEGVQMFSNLQSLACRYEDLYWLPDLSALSQLTWLYCDGNQLTSLDVSNNTTLQSLYCGSNQLTAIDVSANTTLRALDVGSNQLTALDVSANTALTLLGCAYNQLTSINLSANVELVILFCISNQLTALDLSTNTSLYELQCYSNQLTALDLSANTALYRLCCQSNQLTSLDLSNNTALEYLYCYSNQLTSLDLSNNTALTVLSCENNQLTALDVSANTALTYLGCNSNQLTALDVSANTELQSMFCDSNELSALDVSANTALNNLYCYDNLLTDIPDVTGCTNLIMYKCQHNNFGTDDCAMINAIEAMGLSTFVYNPQKDGSTLTCP